MEKVIVKLTPIQASAYWCVNMMRSKVKEINSYRNANDNECEFLELFYSYTDVEWRNIYLGLVEHFTEIVNSMEDDEFVLDTEAGGHNKLNSVLTSIINQSVPDISLAGYSSKDSVISMNNDGASVWYKSCGEMPLSLTWDAEYVLTGDKKELDFYNLLVATIANLGALNPGFRSIPELRERFCREYKKVNVLNDKLQDIAERFNSAYRKANERGLVTGSVYSKMFFSSICSMDIAGLEDYMDIGHHYADVILQREEVFPLPVDNKLKKEN